MKDKEKGKGHPFAGHLHDDEEILWMFKPFQQGNYLHKLLIGNHPRQYAYAVSNQRLLYRNKDNIMTIPLERVPTISLFLGDGPRGTLSFGAVFPMWSDLEDAEQVKSIIERAQKERSKEHSSGKHESINPDPRV